MIDSITGALMSMPISADGRPAAIDLHRLRNMTALASIHFFARSAG